MVIDGDPHTPSGTVRVCDNLIVRLQVFNGSMQRRLRISLTTTEQVRVCVEMYNRDIPRLEEIFIYFYMLKSMLLTFYLPVRFVTEWKERKCKGWSGERGLGVVLLIFKEVVKRFKDDFHLSSRSIKFSPDRFRKFLYGAFSNFPTLYTTVL